MVRNSAYGLILKGISMLGAFCARTVLIYKLGIEYVGLDGLFISILTLLNMAELGFSTAIVYKLYRPIAENDVIKVRAILNYYKKIYRIIGLSVLSLGLVLLPFLSNIVSAESVPNGVNIYILFLVYLADTAISYLLFAHKNALVVAHQRNDIVSKITTSVFILKYVSQILLLLLFQNYYLYVIIIPLSTVLTNIGVAILSKKYYPQYICEGEISKEDRVEIKNKIKALVYNKIGVAIINGSDNIVISKFLGLTVLGIYNSYYYVFSLLYGVFDVFHSAITAGIGNKIITDSREKNSKLFDSICFMNYWAVGICTTCLCALYKPFMSLWIGSDKSMPYLFSILMAFYFFFWMIRFVVLIFKNAQGLWVEDRFRPLIEGIVNLALNLIMVKKYGLFGIVLSTVASMVFISLPWETYVLFKYYFRRSFWPYLFNMVKWTTLISITSFSSMFIVNLLNKETIGMFILKIMICLIISNLVYYIVYRKTANISYMIKFFRGLLYKLKH